jgi:hypothetical protein
MMTFFLSVLSKSSIEFIQRQLIVGLVAGLTRIVPRPSAEPTISAKRCVSYRKLRGVITRLNRNYLMM